MLINNKITDQELIDWVESNSSDKRSIIVELLLPRRNISLNKRTCTHTPTVPYMQIKVADAETRRYTFTQAVENVRKLASERSTALAAAGAIAMRVTSAELQKILKSPFVTFVRLNNNVYHL